MDNASDRLQAIIDNPRDHSPEIVTKALEDIERHSSELETFRLRVRKVLQGESDESILE